MGNLSSPSVFIHCGTLSSVMQESALLMIPSALSVSPRETTESNPNFLPKTQSCKQIRPKDIFMVRPIESKKKIERNGVGEETKLNIHSIQQRGKLLCHLQLGWGLAGIGGAWSASPTPNLGLIHVIDAQINVALVRSAAATELVRSTWHTETCARNRFG